MFEITVILIAGSLCGSLNAIAGGGTFVTLPTLIWFGVPPVVANATATTMAVPGYCASVWAYRSDIRTEGTLRLGTIIALTAIRGATFRCAISDPCRHDFASGDDLRGLLQRRPWYSRSQAPT